MAMNRFLAGRLRTRVTILRQRLEDLGLTDAHIVDQLSGLDAIATEMEPRPAENVVDFDAERRDRGVQHDPGHTPPTKRELLDMRPNRGPNEGPGGPGGAA